METFTPSNALSAHERERLAALLAVIPRPRRWAVEHMHGPLLCALGLVDPPDAAYADAAQRRFVDRDDTRRRVLALLDELDRDARNERYQRRRRQSRDGSRFAPSSGGPG